MIRRYGRLVVCCAVLLTACGQPGTPSAAPTGAGTVAGPPTATRTTPGARGRPDPARLPVAPAPGGLGSARFPDDREGIEALLARLPDTIAGQPRAPQFTRSGPGALTAGYGERRLSGGPGQPALALRVINVPESEFYPPDWGAADVIAALGERGTTPDSGSGRFVGGREGDLYWARADTFVTSVGGGGTPSPERLPLYAIRWGQAGSPWLFGAQAGTPEELEALLAAIVAAARAGG